MITDRWDLFEGDEPEDQLEPEDLPSVSGPEFQPKENTMVIVDKSGVHRLEVRCCDCPNANISSFHRVLLDEASVRIVLGLCKAE